MRIAILTAGTQGDVRPLVALARGLQCAGHSVRLAASTRFEEMTTRAGLAFAPLSSDFGTLHARAQEIMGDTPSLLTAARTFRRLLSSMAEHWAEEGEAACRDADLIVGSAITDLLGASLAEALRKRFVRAYLQPLVPSREIPPVAAPPRRGRYPGPVNRLLHHVAGQVQWYVLRAAFNGIVRPRLGLAPYPWHGPQFSGGAARDPVLCGYSPCVVPPPADWPAHVRVTGYWFLDGQETWQPPAALLSFLTAGPPPIYVGFGSMSSLDPTAATRLVLDALRLTGRRAILATGWNGLGAPQGETSGNAFFLREAPHDWLFQRVTLAVHHGGAGTTAAAIRAGIPSVIIPFLGDQPFWAWRLEILGVAPPRLDRKRVTAERLAQAIDAASAPEMWSRVRHLGERVATEDGVRTAVDALAGWGLLAR